MKTFSTILLSLALLSGGALNAATPILRTSQDRLQLKVEWQEPLVWRLIHGSNPDVYETTASDLLFASDADSLKIHIAKPWQSYDFVIVTAENDSFPTRIIRKPLNVYEEPDPALLEVAQSGLLSREQAEFDIRALIYTLNQVHPDIFSSCDQAVFLRAVNDAISSLPDSISLADLYRKTAPIVALIGDGHTNLAFPMKGFVTPTQKRMPMMVDVQSDKSMTCRRCYDSLIPYGAKIQSINGIPTTKILDAMLPFVSGERQHFKLSRVDGSFALLYRMLFPADEYVVAYLPKGQKKASTVTLPALTSDEMKEHLPKLNDSQSADYSYTVDEAKNVAVMDFRSFEDAGRMKTFADSMFTELNAKNIGNLIIDLRENGGGASVVGDVLLQYISPVPFMQMTKTLIKVMPTTLKLAGGGDAAPGFYFFEIPSTDFIKPLTDEEGHYRGKVMLLTSNHTFSSAGSFAWAFKQCGIGPVIGEETGGMNVSYGDILSYRLPVSDILCTISYKRFWQMNADENDIHGTLPDIAVPAPEAMNVAMKRIRKKK